MAEARKDTGLKRLVIPPERVLSIDSLRDHFPSDGRHFMLNGGHAEPLYESLPWIPDTWVYEVHANGVGNRYLFIDMPQLTANPDFRSDQRGQNTFLDIVSQELKNSGIARFNIYKSALMRGGENRAGYVNKLLAMKADLSFFKAQFEAIVFFIQDCFDQGIRLDRLNNGNELDKYDLLLEALAIYAVNMDQLEKFDPAS